jgi:hypothetical protein
MMNDSQGHDVPMSWTSHHDMRGTYSKVGACSAGSLDFRNKTMTKTSRNDGLLHLRHSSGTLLANQDLSLIPVVRKGLQVMAVSESQHMSSRVN